ncbi:Hpt domain-containing protein [Massilia niastensis]|uniref:Hpt domain-containing protein n=1 Tax=Massilia niastensis TaxID=544911 RepID=UPI00036F5048|nr:Hpt domain-containing protein [Massilia niastensis]
MAHPADQHFFARLAALNEKFADGLPATLDRLAGLAAELDKEAPAPAAAELQAVLHTIAGSAATFGFRGLGQQARTLEQRLRVLTTFDAVAAADWDGWLGELACFVREARRDPKALG